MYSKPAVRIQIRVDVDRGGEIQPLRAMGELRKHVGAYARSRTTLGAFASPADLLAAVFDSDETIDAVDIVLRNTQLDLDTAHLRAVDQHDRFERPAARE
jgi:hypothetical protein